MDTILNAQEHLLRFEIKPSVQRIAIMDYLIAHRIHPTAEDIYNALYEQIPTLSKTTVYNTLKLFAEQGALLVLGIDEKNVRFDIDISDHAHFKCVECGAVYDVKFGDTERLKAEAGENFIITEVHLYYKGYCKKCQESIGLKNKANN